MLKHKKLGVIFIDCWDQHWNWQNPGAPHNNFYHNMIDTLSEYDIDSYVFHNTFLSLKYVTPDVVNYFKEFVNNEPSDSNKRQAVIDLLSATGTERLTPELHTLYENNKSIYIPTFNGFQQWVQTSGIGRWIVVGAHWGICTHTKPLGFENLLIYKKQSPGIKIFSIPSCTAKWTDGPDSGVTICSDIDYAQDHLKWQKVGDNLQELIL